MLKLTVSYAKRIKRKIIQKKLLTKKTKQKERVEVERSFLRAESLFLILNSSSSSLGPSPHVQSRAGNHTPLRDEKESLPTDSVSKASLQKMDHYCKSETKRKKVVKVTSISAGLYQNQIRAKSKTTVSEISHIK